MLLVDGGRGQLNAALAAFDELQIQRPAVISLAMQEEEFYIPDEEEPLKLSRHAYALRLLQYVRDEAHRFAQRPSLCPALSPHPAATIDAGTPSAQETTQRKP